jgi:putative lipoprotein
MRRVALTLLAVIGLAAGCRSGQPGAVPSLLGTSWRAEEIDGRAVPERPESTLAVDDARRITGHTACNRWFGEAEIGDGAIRLKPTGTTRMACPPAVMEQETRFLGALGAATAYRIENGTLLLLDDAGRVRARLTRHAPGRGGGTPPLPLAAYAFDCEGGDGFVLARVDRGEADETVELILPDGRRRLLARTRAASGVRYAAGGVSVWTKGREAMLELEGRTSSCVENRGRSLREDARARGADFRAVGNEPGWVLEFLGDRVVFIGAYGAQRVTTPRPPRQEGATPGDAVYAATTDDHRLVVGVRPTPCVDSMSGERHAATVEVELDGKAYRGCGDALPH